MADPQDQPKDSHGGKPMPAPDLTNAPEPEVDPNPPKTDDEDGER